MTSEKDMPRLEDQHTKARPPRRGKGKVAAGAFDVQKVRPKHAVLGRPVQAQESARGQKRGDAAAQKRRATLLLDARRRVRNAANVVVDRRPAADAPAAAEERMLARWHRERQQKLSARARMFSLGEEDAATEAAAATSALTHLGRTLGERAEDFTDVPAGVDEEADEGPGGDGDYAEETARDEGRMRDAAEGPMDIVARAKERKAERARVKAVREQLVGDLDAAWGDLAETVLANRRRKGDDDVVPTKAPAPVEDEDEEEEEEDKSEEGEGEELEEEFEDLVRELGSEARGRAAERTRRPEEIEREKADALDALERDRMRRMDPDLDDNEEDASGSAGAAAARKLRRSAAEVPRSSDGLAVPESPEALEEATRQLGEQAVVQKIFAANHPSLGENNRAKLEGFFSLLLDALVGISEADLSRIDTLAQGIAFLARELGGHSAARIFGTRLNDIFQSSAGQSKWPKPGELLVLRLVPRVFPASDFRHPVATPAIVLIAACLSRCEISIEDRVGLASGLFLCATAAQFVKQTARVVPEALAFLLSSIKELHSTPNDASDNPPPLPLPISADALAALSLGDFHASAMCAALAALTEFALLWAPKPYGAVLLGKARTLLESTVSSEASAWHSNSRVRLFAETALAACSGVHVTGPAAAFKPGPGAPKVAVPEFRTVERKNPMPPREFAPRMEQGRHLDQAPEERIKKLRRAVARERKVATREVRKDSAFISAERDRSQAEENAEIKRKGGKILAMLQDSQHQEKVEKREKERAHKRLRM